jgi:hypothetical protein
LKKIRTIHSQGLSALKHAKEIWFVLSFEHIKFTINKKYFKKLYDNPNYYASLVIFQTYKNTNTVFKNVHSLQRLF